MSELTEFILARLDEDEATARAAGGEYWYAESSPPVAMVRPGDDPPRIILDSPARLVSYEMTTLECAQHATETEWAEVPW